jgi:hypothetical protein
MEWSQTMPCDWVPHTVKCPITEMPYTDAGAWNLIADLLEAGQSFVEVKLRKPAGDIAYETVVTLRADLPPLYIKIQLKAGRIWGRSFHYALRSSAKEEK